MNPIVRGALRPSIPYAAATRNAAGKRVDRGLDVYSFGCIAEFWDEVGAARAKRLAEYGHYGRYEGGQWASLGSEWDELRQLSVMGWADAVRETGSFNDDLVSSNIYRAMASDLVEVYDSTGGEPDIAAWLAGDPEHMIDSEEQPSPTKTVTLVHSLAVSAAVDVDLLTKYGMAVIAAANILAARGIATRIYMDCTVSNERSGSQYVARSYRVLLKSESDPGDPDVLAFSLAHPANLRVGYFYLEDDSTAPLPNMGLPCDPQPESYDGKTLILPAMRTGSRAGALELIEKILTTVLGSGATSD